MDNALANYEASVLISTAQDAGLAITQEQALYLCETEKELLHETRRVSFGISAAQRIMETLGPSTLLDLSDPAEALAELIEAFYDIREDFPAAFITDDEIIEELRGALDSQACGCVELASAHARAALASSSERLSCEVVDDDGRVFRWDPAAWFDDVKADGWQGERWEADYE